MSRFYHAVAFFFLTACLVLAHSVFAQQHEGPENEILQNPVTVSNEVGIFQGINDIPELVRRTKPFARGLHELRHSADEDGIYDRKNRIEAFEQSKADMFRDAMRSDKVAGSKLPIFSNAWTNIGPINTAGCTKALAFHPTNGNIIYAGAAAGGVWKTTNAGAMWTPLTDLVIPDLAVASIAVDPQMPNTIYVGSGDPSVATDGLPGTGLYKSSDGGGTWVSLDRGKLPSTINKVLVHPANSAIVFACSYDNNRGLYRSTDSGATFTRVFPTAKNADGIIWDIIAADVVAGKLEMYCVEGNNPSESSTECGIYKSTDDGATWSKVISSGLPAGNNIGKSALAIPVFDKTKIYCLMARPDGNFQGLYKSVNSAASFASVAGAPNIIFNPTGNGPQGWYDLYLAIGPHTETNDTLYIGGVNAYYSFNSGTSWNSYSDYGSHFSVHVDHQSIAIDPVNSRNVFIGTDGGIYRSVDAGQNWVYRSKGFQTMRFYHIGLDKGDFLKTYGGAQDQGTWRTVSGQGPWQVLGGDGFQPIVDPENSNIIYAEGPFGDLYKSTDGATFNSINDGAFIQNSGSYEESDWETPFVMAPKNSSTLFAGRQRVWQTTNAGDSWKPISNKFIYGTRTYLIESIGLSPADPQTYWAGLEKGKIQLTTNGGTNWIDRSTALPNATVRSIVCHPTDKDWALAAFEVHSGASARIMRTTNGGASWTNVSGSASRLPAVPVNCIALDSTSPLAVWYAATDNGIYYTRDTGTTWSVAGAGLGLAACWDVQIHSNKVTIRVGTHGRSIWESNVNTLPVVLTGLTATKTQFGTRLDWKTEIEKNNSGFKVERSYNYQPFEEITFVPGAINSNKELLYDYTDPKKDDGYYLYRLSQVDLDGTEHLSNTVEVRYGAGVALRLDQNFPNPFVIGVSTVPSTRIRYELPDADEVTLKIYSLSGALIRTLADHLQQNGGEQNMFFDGTDNNGISIASGRYQYVLETKNSGELWNKMIVVGK